MKQTEKLQQQLKDNFKLVIDNTRRCKYTITDENGNLIIERTPYFKAVKQQCEELGLLK